MFFIVLGLWIEIGINMRIFAQSFHYFVESSYFCAFLQYRIAAGGGVGSHDLYHKSCEVYQDFQFFCPFRPPSWQCTMHNDSRTLVWMPSFFSWPRFTENVFLSHFGFFFPQGLIAMLWDWGLHSFSNVRFLGCRMVRAGRFCLRSGLSSSDASSQPIVLCCIT